jgi:hypothetical protein
MLIKFLTAGKVLMRDQNLANFEKIMESKTILWNGPLGVFEMEILQTELLLWELYSRVY